MRETVRLLMAHGCDRVLHAGHSKHSHCQRFVDAHHRSVPWAARLQGSSGENTSDSSDDLVRPRYPLAIVIA